LRRGGVTAKISSLAGRGRSRWVALTAFSSFGRLCVGSWQTPAPFVHPIAQLRGKTALADS
jgi:hypothetical protein